MERTRFEVETGTGTLAGWYAGNGPPVLALHGGPGLSCGYLDDALLELAERYQVAGFQQRGIAPSTEQGSFTIEEAVSDVAAVLDGLGWRTAHLVGHSWGGHLALHVATSIPARVAGVLLVDPLGAVGDGGSAQFGEELMARVPERQRGRIKELEVKEEAGDATPEESVEVLRLYWPSYFADPTSAPPPPPVSLSVEAHLGLWADLNRRLPALEAALPSLEVKVGILLGGRSPMPSSAGAATADRIPGAWIHVEPDAGHFVWHEAPGSVVAALDRLLTR